MPILHAPILEQAGFSIGDVEPDPVIVDDFLDGGGMMHNASVLNEDSELWSNQ